MFEDGARRGSVAGALAHVAPHDGPVGVDYEDRRRGEPVPEEVVDVEGLSHLVVRITQHGVGRFEDSAYVGVDIRGGGDGHRDELRPGVPKGLVLVAQLDQLRVVRPSPAAFEEDQNDGSFLQLTCQREGPAAGTLQDEVWCDRRYLRPRIWCEQGRLGQGRGGRLCLPRDD